MSKPIEYHLEAYLRTLKADPFASFTSNSTYPTFAPGQWISANGFGTRQNDAEFYRVVSVGHVMWEVATHIGHKLMLVVEPAYALDDPNED